MDGTISTEKYHRLCDQAAAHDFGNDVFLSGALELRQRDNIRQGTNFKAVRFTTRSLKDIRALASDCELYLALELEYEDGSGHCKAINDLDGTLEETMDASKYCTLMLEVYHPGKDRSVTVYGNMWLLRTINGDYHCVDDLELNTVIMTNKEVPGAIIETGCVTKD